MGKNPDGMESAQRYISSFYPEIVVIKK